MKKNKKDALLEHYREARNWIEHSPFAREVAWQASVISSSFSEQDFLREYAWVVLNSGFRESVVRKHFSYISLCYCDWESAQEITNNQFACVHSASRIFAHMPKLTALTSTAQRIANVGFDLFRKQILADPVTFLETLPYIGEATKWHLAKNLGMDVAKPDRHLVRLAEKYGYGDVNVMCRDISSALGDRVAITDIVLWRFEEQFRSPRIQLSY